MSDMSYWFLPPPPPLFIHFPSYTSAIIEVSFCIFNYAKNHYIKLTYYIGTEKQGGAPNASRKQCFVCSVPVITIRFDIVNYMCMVNSKDSVADETHVTAAQLRSYTVAYIYLLYICV